MAHIDNEKLGFAEPSSKDDGVVAELDGKVDAAEQKEVLSTSVLNPPTANSNVSSGAASSSSVSHPKKFSSVNINKKFLEKNSTAPSASQSSSSTAKSGISNPKPVLQPTAHSRLVTTKLTTVLPPSTLTGPGWSRPSSVTPVASTSSSPPVPSGATPPAANAVSPHAAPQLPHVGKVIQPQPRGSAISPGANSKKDSSGSNQPVWGRLRGSMNSMSTDVQNDFPTAAEVAQVRSARMVEKQEAAQSAAAQKQALRAEADAFRGVHLDPNAHHWDEMEEDDDNFLDEVIDFGDGRQYTVQPVESQPSQQDGPSDPTQDQHSRPPDFPTSPVRKEDRFADDFDRSWPRSRQHPPLNRREQPLHAPLPPSQAPPLHSQESSRVLFNERSNRLEPYSGRANPYPPSRRGSRSDAPSPTDSRGVRDLPSHSQSQNVQLLQKSESTVQRPRKLGSYEPPLLDIDGPRERGSWRDTLSPSSPMYSGRPPSQASQQDHGRRWSRDFSDDPGRRGSFSSARAQSSDRGRQAPPHMTQVPPPSSPSIGDSTSRSPLLSRDDKLPPMSHGIPASPSLSTHSLTSSTHASKTALSPVIDDETRQAAMHNAAERARRRRQQEEEERESQKERARKKAAEIELKIQAEKHAKAEEDEKAREAEEAAAKGHKPSQAEVSEPPLVKSPWGRPPSLRGAPRDAPGPPRPAAMGRRSSNAGCADPVGQTDSWRAKAAPLPPAPLPPMVEAAPSKPPPPTLVAEVDPLTVEEGEDVEVIDFSEFGKFVGAPEPPVEPHEPSSPPSVPEWSERTLPVRRPERALPAERSESAEDRPRELPLPTKSDVVSWRRKVEDGAPALQDSTRTVPIDLTSTANDDTLQTPPPPSRPRINPVEHPNSASHPNAQRSPRANAFREASMSALDDAMSRIKGALDHMHDLPKEARTEETKEAPSVPSPSTAPPLSSTFNVPIAQISEPPRPSKWLPPALRPRDPVSNPFGLEIEDPVTLCPPESPKPVWNTFTVRMPKDSTTRGPLTKRQFNLTKNPSSSVRWEILSWNPPVEGMSKRDLSLNDVLFRKPAYFKGKIRVRVSLPAKTRGSHVDNLTPKVNIPNRPVFSKVPTTGAFGRPRGADEISSWRRLDTDKPSLEVDAILDTVSRSPPPVPQSGSATLAPPVEVQLASVENGVIARSRNQPKMLAGSDVGFYRAPLKEKSAVAVINTVSFTVTSELDEGSDHASVHRTSAVSNSTHSEFLITMETDPNSPVPGLVQSKIESKSSDASPEHAPITPPLQSTNTTWTKSPLTFPIKESTVRAPDPEHLKIVWSKSETKDELPSINSLEGIADDFTTVPFTLQDVKSEDGETPPPTAPSRMSLSEVTRAFQQVPSRPGSTHPRPNHSTVSSPAPVPQHRQSNYGLPPPAQQNMRPTYGAYHSPVMSHSPAPVMYPQGLAPSPVPGRMMINGHPPHYGQPVWMPVSGGPTGQVPTPMMRPVHSPFPAQVMSYPSPGPPMYPPPQMANGHNHMPHPNGPSRGRGGIPMMSPVMSPANPAPHPNMMYPGSPVVMPGYPPPPPPGSIPGGGRGQLRNGFDNMSALPPPPSGPPQPPSYAPILRPW